MKEEVQKALEVLRKGGVILYPTDTVWGIGCDATNSEAVSKIFEIKHRQDSKSMVLLASDMDMVCRYVKEVPEKPMTIIYPGAQGLPPGVVAEDGTVGIRIPMMDFCRQLSSRLGRPVVSTSANVSGEPAPKCFAEISGDIKSAVDHTVDPQLEKASSGQPSSIIKVGLDYSIEIIRK